MIDYCAVWFAHSDVVELVLNNVFSDFYCYTFMGLLL